MLVLVTVAAVGMLAGCSGGAGAAAASGSTSTSPMAASMSSTPSAAVRDVQGRAGALEVGDGYVREPASPDVAAAYLTVLNTGGTPARLTAVRSPVAPMVMPMTETDSGSVGSMAPLNDVVVPAHGAFRFHPGAAHLMLEHPNPVPTAGGTVSLTLTFTPGGAITVTLPVTPIGADGSAMSAPSTGMSSAGMPGMSMPNG